MFASNAGLIISFHFTAGLLLQAGVFHPGFYEWLPGVLPKQAEFAWDDICNQSSMWL